MPSRRLYKEKQPKSAQLLGGACDKSLIWFSKMSLQLYLDMHSHSHSSDTATKMSAARCVLWLLTCRQKYGSPYQMSISRCWNIFNTYKAKNVASGLKTGSHLYSMSMGEWDKHISEYTSAYFEFVIMHIHFSFNRIPLKTSLHHFVGVQLRTQQILEWSNLRGPISESCNLQQVFMQWKITRDAHQLCTMTGTEFCIN